MLNGMGWVNLPYMNDRVYFVGVGNEMYMVYIYFLFIKILYNLSMLLF